LRQVGYLLELYRVVGCLRLRLAKDIGEDAVRRT